MAHATDIVNRHYVYKDGKIAFENLKDGEFKREYREYGEDVLYLMRNLRGKGYFDTRWEERMWYGVSDRMGEVIIGTTAGVVKVRDEVAASKGGLECM